MSYVRCLRGLVSGIEFSADAPMNLDPADGRPVEMVLDFERLAAEQPNAQWYDPSRRDMWRFGANPTQSFKDRGMAMVVAQARRLGLTRPAVPTQGSARLRAAALEKGFGARVKFARHFFHNMGELQHGHGLDLSLRKAGRPAAR